MTGRRIIFAATSVLLIALIADGCRYSSDRELTIALAVFPEEAARYRVFAEDFERRNHVRIAIIAQNYGDILQVMRTQAAAGQGQLDLAELDLAMLGEARSSARQLDWLIDPSSRALFPDAAWQAASADGHIYFVPHRLMWQAMIYNRTEVPNPPVTWNDLARFAREHPGKLALKAALYEGAICDAMPFVWSAGADICPPESPGAANALTFLGSIAPSLNPQSAVFREMSVLEAQARGAVWIHFNWPFAMEYLHSKGLAPQDDLSAPVPRGPEGSATALGGGYLAMPASAPHPEIAAAFIKYLLNAATQERLSRELGWYGSIPPSPGSEDAMLYSGFTAMRPFVRARPAVDCYTEISNRWQRAIRSVLFDRESPQTALRAVARPSDADNYVLINSRGGGCDCRLRSLR
ncbi:MAG TPA: extracellular solute-binding protein [Candidatus Binataceae bacterium]